MKAAAAGLRGAEGRASACTGLLGSCGLSEAVEVGGAQAGWAALAVADRLRVVRRARQRMASCAEEFAAAISPALARTKADTLLAELLPLLDACRFLEREAKDLLAPRKLGSSGRPLWHHGVVAEIHREPMGHVLVIGPSNFPLFLPGVQVMQALVAGNTVTWKPGVGGERVAQMVADILRDAGLPTDVLTVTDESVDAARRAIASGPDKVIFTGSSKSGKSLLAELAKASTPAVVELSGVDAVIVAPSADLARVAKAVAFGLRLNGGAVCMSPRRLFAERTTMAQLRPMLEVELAKVQPVVLDATTFARLKELVDAAVEDGASLRGALVPEAQKPLLVDHAAAGMAITRSDVFAPVLALIEVASMLQVPELYAECPYGLGVSIFCDKSNEKRARVLAKLLKAGTVLINDMIAPTADPRVPFGGRGISGYGVTRGAEGLLEMTTVKTILVRHGGASKHLEATRDEDAAMVAGLIETVHGKGFSARWTAMKQMVKSARR